MSQSVFTQLALVAVTRAGYSYAPTILYEWIKANLNFLKINAGDSNFLTTGIVPIDANSPREMLEAA